MAKIYKKLKQFNILCIKANIIYYSNGYKVYYDYR